MAIQAEKLDIHSPTIAVSGMLTGTKKEKVLPFLPFHTPLDPFNRLLTSVTKGLYGNTGGQAADELIAPPLLGLGTPKLLYGRFKGVMSRTLEKYEGQHVEVDAHSYGGVLMLMYVHYNPGLDISLRTWSSPVGLFRNTAEEMRRLRDEQGDDAADITLIGSDGDRLVPPQWSLPDFAGAPRVLFTKNPDSALSNGLIPIEVDEPPDHVDILNHPKALELRRDMPSISARQVMLSLVESS